jgi:aerobic-type carbon monoxide dehydrogenase small subunit (CoxS/CutS family)
MTETRTISRTVNSQPRRSTVEMHITLVDHLSEQFRLTGTDVGCKHAVSGPAFR